MSRVAGPFTRCPCDKLPASAMGSPEQPPTPTASASGDAWTAAPDIVGLACGRVGLVVVDLFCGQGYPRVARSLPQFADQAGGLLGGEVGEVAAGDGGGDGGQCEGVGVGHQAGLVVGLEFGFEVEQGAESVDPVSYTH